MIGAVRLIAALDLAVAGGTSEAQEVVPGARRQVVGHGLTYRITVRDSGVRVEAEDCTGAAQAAASLFQLCSWPSRAFPKLLSANAAGP